MSAMLKDWPRSQAEWLEHVKEWNHHKLAEWWERNRERFDDGQA